MKTIAVLVTCLLAFLANSVLSTYEQDSNHSRKGQKIISGEIRVSLEEFESLFFKDNAKHSFDQYHTSVKDKDVNVSSWNALAKDRSKRLLERELEFIHSDYLTTTHVLKR